MARKFTPADDAENDPELDAIYRVTDELFAGMYTDPVARRLELSELGYAALLILRLRARVAELEALPLCSAPGCSKPAPSLWENRPMCPAHMSELDRSRNC